MVNVEKILVATDFSAPAEEALRAAEQLARGFEADLHLLHAVRKHWDESIDESRHVAEVELETRRKRIVGEGLTCDAEVSLDVPSQAISERAAALAVDLIAMGTRGRTGLDHVLLGSVAERVARTAPCPVLSVTKLTDPAFKLRTILVAMDFSPPAQEALAVAEALSRQVGPAKLVLVHAQYVPVDIQYVFAEQGTQLPRPSLGPVADELEAVLKRLQDAGITAEYVAEPGNPERVIVEVAERMNADLIAMGTHGRSGLSHFFLGSVAERILRTAPCPVLTTRAGSTGEINDQ